MTGRRFSVTVSLILACLFLLGSCAQDMRVRKKREEAIRNLGEAYMVEGEYTAALKEFLKALDLYAEDPFLHNNLGLIYMTKEKPDLAVEHFKKAIKLNPEFAPARNNLGAAYLAMKDWDAAIETFKEVTEDILYATPHYPLSNLGWAYFNKGEYKTAEMYYKRALKEQSDFVIALRGLGMTYIAMRNARDAIDSLEKAVKISPEFAEAYYDLARAYTMSRKRGKAVDALEKVIELAPDTPLADKAESKIRKLEGR